MMKKPGTILFVDDEPLSLKYFKASVGKYADVKTASSPGAALEILEKDGATISVVVSDERMPRASGVEFLSGVRKSWPSTIRVLTSAYANIDNLQHAINDAGVYRFIPKPWDLDVLSATIHDALQVEHQPASELPFLAPPLSDREDPSVLLLSILARGFNDALKGLDSHVAQVAALASNNSFDATSGQSPFIAAWSSRLRMARIATSATHLGRDVQHCRSLANSINDIAGMLADPFAVTRTSVAECLAQTIDEVCPDPVSVPPPDFVPTLDFHCAIPAPVLKLILRSAVAPAAHRMASRVTLIRTATHNEILITFAGDEPLIAELGDATWRIVRSALWAYDGEMTHTVDQKIGDQTVTLRLVPAT
jgi:two-component system, probable response regulator PhcQ